MRKFLFLLIVATLFFTACDSSKTTPTNDNDTGNTADSVSDNDMGDSADVGNTADDTADTGDDTGDTTDSGVDSDSSDSGDSVSDNDISDTSDTVPDEDLPESDGIITKIRKGDYSEGDTVSFGAVVVGVVYNMDNSTHQPIDIKGLFVSEFLATAQPWTGIFLFFKTGSPLNSYKIGDKLSVSGVYKVYYGQDQVEVSSATVEGTFPVPTPALITDTTKVATPFVSDGSGGWDPGTTHGVDAKSYQSVFITTHGISITNSDLGHGNWEVTGQLAVDKMMYYYSSDRSVGVKFDTIQGILVYSYDAYRLAPRRENDLVLEGAADTGDSGDTTDTGNTSDTADSGDTADTGDTSDTSDTGTGLSIRIVAGNISTGNNQSYDPDEGRRIFKALKGDVMLVQEFNYGSNSSTDYQSMANEVCPVATCYVSCTHPSAQIPNGIISRWPITAEGSWDDPNINNRELDWAIIDIPGSRNLFVVSVHLHTSPPSDQVTAAQVIAKEVYNHRTAHPNQYYYVVGGDFNGPAAVSNSGFGQWNGSDIFYISGPHPEGEDGNENTNANRNKHYDYVLADHPLQAFQVPVVYHSTTDSDTKTYDDGLVFDTRNFSQTELNEFFPGTTTGDSGASNMQHMAIVKDFYIH